MIALVPRKMILAAALAGICLGRAYGTEPVVYNGHYELSSRKDGRTFSLDVRQKGSRADVSFAAAMEDGSGASPEGEGKGRVRDGVLSFKFKDSFQNEGTCTLSSRSDGFHLSMTVLKVVEPSPFHFYGDNLLLRKTSSQPQ